MCFFSDGLLDTFFSRIFSEVAVGFVDLEVSIAFFGSSEVFSVDGLAGCRFDVHGQIMNAFSSKIAMDKDLRTIRVDD